MFHTFSKGMLVIIASAGLAGCASGAAPQPTAMPGPTATPELTGPMPNPASENCTKQGGQPVIQTRPDGAEYGVCMFEDNMSCEEWALFNGECPVGGVKVTGYVTQAAYFCAITGGTYQATENGNTEQEKGTCTFKNGQSCDAGDYFAGTCDPNAEAE